MSWLANANGLEKQSATEFESDSLVRYSFKILPIKTNSTLPMFAWLGATNCLTGQKCLSAIGPQKKAAAQQRCATALNNPLNNLS